MKLVMTLLVRDEADVIDAQVAFHLNAGVDYVIATDHRSQDGTTEILERYAREGYLHLIREDSEEFSQSDWVTRMARLAATDFGADWVINSDGDEFWWPRGSSLADALAYVPARYGIVHAVWRPFIPRPDTGQSFAELMTVRLSPHAAINSPASPFRPNAKIAHRADPKVVVGTGNHHLNDSMLISLRSWYPIELLHFPLRKNEQIARKYAAVQDAWGRERGLAHIDQAVDLAREGRTDEIVQSLGTDPGALERGLAEGVLVRDTRLRDALRALAGVEELPGRGEPPPRFTLPRDGGRLGFPRPTVVDDALFAVEAAVVMEADEVRAQRRLDELERRISELERGAGPRLRRVLRRFVRRTKTPVGS